MTDSAFRLRQGDDGPVVRGTPGHALVFQADGSSVAGEPVIPGGVTSVFGRLGNVIALVGDYDSNEVDNASSVTGSSVSDALNQLDTDAAAAATAAANAQSTANAAGTAAAAAQSDATAAGTAAANAQSTANAAGTAAAAAQATATAAEQPFKATMHVDPGFGGTSTGSASNPFTTAAAAFAAMIALALPGGTIRIPPGVTLTENIVFPATGGIWEIVGSGFFGSSTGSRITGTITCNVTSGLLDAQLTNLVVNGNTTGLAATGTLLSLNETSVRQVGTITITTAGSGVALGNFRGIGPAWASKFGGSNTGLVSIQGQISAENWVFEGGCTEALATAVTPYQGSTWRSCQLGSTNGTAVTMNLNGASNAFFYDCMCAGPVTLASTTTGYTVYMDGATLAAFGNPLVGLALTGTGMVLKTLNANLSAQSTVTGNVAATAYGARSPAGAYQVDYTGTLTAVGTLGFLQFAVTYTDATGTVVTENVGSTLDITAAVGTKVRGSLVFEHNGSATPIKFSFAGITTAGAMAVSHISAVKRLN